MDREQILDEIRRLATEHGGQAPGRQAFARSTGVRMSSWYPHIWLRWGDALAEAGYAPNGLQTKMRDEILIENSLGLLGSSEDFRLRVRFDAKQERIELSQPTPYLADLAENRNCSTQSLRIVAKLRDLTMS